LSLQVKLVTFAPGDDRSAAIGAKVTDAAHHLVEGGQARLRGGAWERIPPRFLACIVGGIWIATVATVTVVLAFRHSTLLN